MGVLNDSSAMKFPASLGEVLIRARNRRASREERAATDLENAAFTATPRVKSQDLTCLSRRVRADPRNQLSSDRMNRIDRIRSTLARLLIG